MIMKVHRVAIRISSRFNSATQAESNEKLKTFVDEEKFQFCDAEIFHRRAKEQHSAQSLMLFTSNKARLSKSSSCKKKLFSSRLMQKHFHQVSPIL